MRSDVLIIDDEPAIRRLLVGALDRSGISHAEAASAGEALRLAKAQPAPLVALLDLGLPDRDGLEIVPQLAALGLAVIVLTARDATEEKVAALDLGADDFVTKPFDSEELLARVRSALRRKAAKPPPCGGCAAARSRPACARQSSRWLVRAACSSVSALLNADSTSSTLMSAAAL